MKTNLLTTWLLITCLNLTCAIFSLAEDDDEDREIEFPTSEETLKFLEKEMPIAIKVLAIVKKAEGMTEYREVLQNFRDDHYDYKDLLEFDGKEPAELFLKGKKFELEVDLLLYQYDDDSKSSSERKAIENQIKELLKKQLVHDKEVTRKELKIAEEYVQEIKDELRELESIGDAELTRKLKRLIR